ncbi:hypothetical protein [Staphylococcus succinus]|uniref:hypothetical protein n=1 Tax=Staphylococcus succinus TaxID=61015 RepID=UPI000E69D221|nr:hypothetical protein [Staphylococcus succinus]RIN27713.1 hypothetical protein BU067_01520 [Staphylococcus succinus]
MSNKENEHENEGIRSDYGFRANLRIGVMTLITRIDFLEELFSIRYNMNWKRFWIYVAELFILWGSYALVVANFATIVPYVGIWLTLMMVCFTVMLGFHAFLLPSGGSLFDSVCSYLFGLFRYYLVYFGFVAPSKKTKIDKVLDDGTIVWDNGDYMVMLLIDGKTSATAYASEIKNLEGVSKRYQNARNRTTTEFHITSSKRQELKEQINSNKVLEKNSDNKAIKSVLRAREYQLEKVLDGKFQTEIQYKCLREKSLRELNMRLEAIDRYTNGGGYYSAIRLTKQETEEYLKAFYGFK